MILEELNNKSNLTHNVNIEKLYNMLKKGYLKVNPQNDNASSNAKKGLPELCFSRSDMKPQHTGENPSNDLRIGQMIKVEFDMEKLRNSIRGLKKPYPVSFGNANKEFAGDTEARGEERIQVDKIPIDKKYMTIYVPDDLFKTVQGTFGDRNKNVKKFIRDNPDFLELFRKYKNEGLIKYYKDTSRKAYQTMLKNSNVKTYFDY